MQKFNTQGIVLGRTNYGEAGRIITFLTPDHGKVKVMAKGVRKAKSKLAGGIELFSVSDIGVIKGRGEIDTLVSSRLLKHFGNIVKDIDRTNTAYEFIKQLNKQTEDQTEEAYFVVLQTVLESLNSDVDLDLIKLWFKAQLLRLAGRQPNLRTDSDGQQLDAAKKYDFDYELMCFKVGRTIGAEDIKLLRLVFGGTNFLHVSRLGGIAGPARRCLVLVIRIEPKF